MIEFVVETAIVIFIIALLSILTAAIVFARSNRIKLVKTIIQLEADKQILLDRLDKKIQELELKKLEGTDEFVTFISQSREWAFDYIEQVQIAIHYLKNAMAADNEEEINLAYKHLIDLLPKEENEEKQK